MQKWSVLLIGGPNGTGKTTVAGKLSRTFKIPFMELDDVRVAMQTVAQEDKFPGFNSFFEAWPDILLKKNPKDLVKEYLMIAKYVWNGLDYIIQNHINNKQPLIIEGDLIVPSLIEELNREEVESVFLYDSRAGLYKRELGESFDEKKKILYGKFVDFNYELGQEVVKQARNSGLRVIPSSPIESLYKRLRTLL